MNQKLKKDAGKLRYDLIPPEVLAALAEIYTFGLEKGYEEESWRNVETKRYHGATMRHFNAYRLNPSILDEESGKHHIKHFLWNAATLVMKECYMKEAEQVGNSEQLPISRRCEDCALADSEINFCKNCTNYRNFTPKS